MELMFFLDEFRSLYVVISCPLQWLGGLMTVGWANFLWEK